MSLLMAPAVQSVWTISSDSTQSPTKAEQSRGAESSPWPRCFGCSPECGWLLCCELSLLGHVELLINQHTPVLLSRAVLNPFSAQPVPVLRIASTHVHLASSLFTKSRAYESGVTAFLVHTCVCTLSLVWFTMTEESAYFLEHY